MALRPSTVFLIILFLLGFLTCPLVAAVPPVPEQPANYVVDLAGIIDSQTEADLNRRLQELEDQTTAQLVVLTIDSLEGEPMEKFSLRTAEKWALGQKGKDNGVLITIALQDRRYRIEVGYGLEASLPDSYLGSLARQHFVPNFRQGKYSQGIEAVVLTIVDNLISEKVTGVTVTRSPDMTETSKEFSDFLSFPIVLIFLLPILILGGLVYFATRRGWSWPSDRFWGYGGEGYSGDGGLRVALAAASAVVLGVALAAVLVVAEAVVSAAEVSPVVGR